MYGTQTALYNAGHKVVFENDVKMYGTQTRTGGLYSSILFENDVKMYGTQTVSEYFAPFICLRMM